MLSNVSIQRYLKTKDIIISPWQDEMLGAAKVTLHLGTRMLIPKGNTIVDIKKKTLPDYQTIFISDEKPLRLDPGMFVLGETYETIGISEKIGCLLEGRSTFARLGITVVQTAMAIATGQKPKVMTLEIKNHGTNAVLLYPKMKFCKAVFFLLKPQATMRYDTNGKYLEDDPQKPIFDKEF